MSKTLQIKLSGSEAGRIESAVAKCDLALSEIFRLMKKDQSEINKLKAETHKILREIRAEMKVA